MILKLFPINKGYEKTNQGKNSAIDCVQIQLFFDYNLIIF